MSGPFSKGPFLLMDIAIDAGDSRFYGGIHYQPSINIGLRQGKTVAADIINTLSSVTEFKK
jgi:hypothetical protein